MQSIIDGVLRFQKEVFPAEQARYQELSTGQSPSALFIGCSDSRIVPEIFTQQGPGNLFVVRNAGNIIPPYGPTPGGVTASIEYAVEVLGVPNIIVCGHSDCGAMKALVQDPARLEMLPSVSRWLHYSDTARQTVADRFAGDPGAPESVRLDALVHENVLAQLANVLTHPEVARDVKTGRLRIHGWVFDIASGSVETYNIETRRFVPLNRGEIVHATPAL